MKAKWPDENGATSAASAAAAPDSPTVNAAIARAKFEWESTVDALPHVICLLDAGGRVVRVNRVVERWNLGSVTEVLGRDLHGLLHGACAAVACPMRTALNAAWDGLQDGGPVEFEQRDMVLGRALHVTLRRTTPRPAPRGTGASEALAVAVVADYTALHLAREALNTINAELESRVKLRTEALADANRDLQNEIVRRGTAEQELRRSRNDQATLSRQLLRAQEQERKRIARELHDSVGQQLSAIKYSLERGELAQQQGRAPDSSILQRAIASLQDTLAELRGIAMDLRPPVLDDLGAASAVSWFCRQFAQSYPDLAVREAVEVADAEVPERLGTAVFRCAQELLNNVAKHARARQVLVRLARAGDRLVLEVTDDGVGLGAAPPAATLGSGRGIHNLRERAEMTGGELSLMSGEAETGTRARVDWHLAAAEVGKTNAA
ncbi:MAG TPA: sensor histidine kinase [Steroidobacteraceae bacterium]|jgi:signal transduction histidine kinase|nr:sensor histidine kinase [Steroidobacteraceae bacterium]